MLRRSGVLAHCLLRLKPVHYRLARICCCLGWPSASASKFGAGKRRNALVIVRQASPPSLHFSQVATRFAVCAAPCILGQFATIICNGVEALWLGIVQGLGRTLLVILHAQRATGDARYSLLAGSASMLVMLAGRSWLLGVYFGFGLMMSGLLISLTNVSVDSLCAGAMRTTVG